MYGVPPGPKTAVVAERWQLVEFRLYYIGVMDQVSGQDGWILAKFFFCVFMDRKGVDVDP